MSDAPDPTVSLEQKLTTFAASLSDDELQVLHDVIHLAYGGSEVQAFAVPKRPDGLMEDPCMGGEVTFPNTYAMIATLHTSLHRPRQPGPPGTPIPYPNQG